MSESSSALDALTKVIVDTVKKIIGDANFDKSAQGVVKAVNGNTYTISVFGSTYDITTDQVYSVGQKVIVTALQGNMQRLVCSPDNIGTMHTINSQVKTVDDRLNDLESDYSDTVTKVDGITGQIDGQYQQWFYNEPPTLTNEPAKDWTTDDAKKSHIGDLYYDKTNDVAYQWTYKDGTYSWTVADNLIRVALAKAATAQDTADSKRRVFYNTPSPPYDKGDVWMQGDAGDILICKTAKTITQSYSASDWGVASKYTDDSAANKAQSTADSAKDTADKAYSSIVDLCIEGDTTKIDGSHIYTGTIDASAIKAGTVTADQIAADSITINNMALGSTCELLWTNASPRSSYGDDGCEVLTFTGKKTAIIIEFYGAPHVTGTYYSSTVNAEPRSILFIPLLNGSETKYSDATYVASCPLSTAFDREIHEDWVLLDSNYGTAVRLIRAFYYPKETTAFTEDTTRIWIMNGGYSNSNTSLKLDNKFMIPTRIFGVK